MARTFDAFVEVIAEVSETHPEMATMTSPADDIHMTDIPNEEVIDYEDSTKEEPAKPSSDIDDA